MEVNFRDKLQNCFLFHVFISGIKENNYTVGCDIQNYIFTKANFLMKFMKISCHKNFRLYGISFTVIRLLCV